MAIRIGSSCCTGTTKPTAYDKVAEVRHVRERDDFWANVDFCMARNIYVIANIDNWQSLSPGYYRYIGKEQQWRQRVDGIVHGLIQRDYTAKKWRITIDNEPMKPNRLSREEYAWLVNIAYDQIKNARGYKHVLIGAGNEEFSLAHARGNMLEYICQNAQFDILDTHWQVAVVDPRIGRLSNSALNHWANFASYLRATYRKPLGCSEVNWFDVAKQTGYGDLLTLLIKIESLGIEDFPIVFMQRDLNHQHPYTWLCFIYNKVIRSPFWEDWKRIISEKEPREVIVYNRPKELQDFYNATGLKTSYHESQPNLPIVGRKNPSDSVRWADLDAVVENLFKGLFGALQKAGALPEDFAQYPNIKYSGDGDYISNWSQYAKSNPK